ncbi:DnaJ-like cysteine-rich domain-containing protein [Shewanella marisflavi]|uniref:CR-type domain-containing protein n=1 Tax=Shewanella marisflavi TaxID=260364 RepID=A0AAC9U0I7_9GAMM|nr:hypothetical protein [Shewanella marisflavi]ASJ97303.1 hypothetical protein CFF01_12350 [Shewanella marisflavi]
MSQLQQFQDFIRNNGKQLTGVDVPVNLSDEQAKHPQLNFTFGWRIEIGVNAHEHGGHRPAGVNCGTSSDANDEANKAAKEYVSGRDPLFNERFIKILGPDVSKNFLIKNTRLDSAPDTYVGQDICSNCSGSGCTTCRSCHGSGSSSCYSCNGSGRQSVSRYDSYNNRTVYTTESCSSCYGSGRSTCSSCNGKGHVTCRTCDGGGYLYYSYTIDGEAKRSSKWQYTSSDYHEWTGDFIKRTGLKIVHGLTDIKEVDVEGDLDGCTFVYAFTATLPTLQFTASIDNVNTKMCFAGKQNLTHDAGGIYDPAVWQVGQKLGAGNKRHDTDALATPAIKNIIEADATKSDIALLKENWVSTDIKDAVVANYTSLVAQLKKQSVKGIIPNMLGSFVKYSYLFLTLGIIIALLFPQFADETQMRMGIMEYPQWVLAVIKADFALFGIHPLANYVMVLGLFYASYQLIKRYYWKNIGKGKTLALALGFTLLFPHVALSLYYNTITAFQHPPQLLNALTGGALFAGLYLLVLGVSKPKKWYLKPVGLVVAAALYIALQFAIAMLNGAFGEAANQAKYVEELAQQIASALLFIRYNFVEILLLSLLFGYFLTRRQFWNNAKSEVSDYNSPVLLKSMNMER